MDYTVHRVSKSRTGLSDFHFHFPGFLPLAQVVGPIPTPSSAWYIPRCIFASPVAYLLVKDSNMRQLYSKETRIRDKVRRQEEIRDPYHAGFSSFTQESHIAPHMRVCRQEHLGNWQMPLTCRVLPPPFLEVIPADLLVGSNFCPIYSGNTHLSAQTQGHSLWPSLSGPTDSVHLCEAQGQVQRFWEHAAPPSPAFPWQPLVTFLASLPDVLGHCWACSMSLADLSCYSSRLPISPGFPQGWCPGPFTQASWWVPSAGPSSP